MPAKNRLLVILIFLFINTISFALPTYKMSIEGESLINDTTAQVNVYIENIGSEFVLTSYQCAFSINQSIDFSNFSLKYVNASSELKNKPDTYIGLDNIDGMPELTFVSFIGQDTISTKTLVGRFELNGNLNQLRNINLAWNFEGTISTIITGDNFINITNPSNHVSSFITNPIDNNDEDRLEISTVIASNNTSAALRVIDGKGIGEDEDSRWATAGMPATLIFDLGKKQEICKTRFSFFNFANGRIYKYNIRISDDMYNWTEVLSEVSSKNEEWSEENFDAVEARYLELEFVSSSGPNNGDWATLWEAEIWGSNSATVVEEELIGDETIPNKYGLSQNYPNPFNPSTNVQVEMKESGNAQIDVFNLLGERVLAVLDTELSAGTHEINIDGSHLASGVYIYRLNVNNEFTEVKKMNLIK